MDMTIRNLDERAYRALKARAALTGRTIGETVNEAIRVYLARPGELPRSGSLADIEPVDYPEGSERLSEDVDALVYGTESDKLVAPTRETIPRVSHPR